MTFTRKLMLVSTAILLPLGLVVELSGVASAARSNTTGTGTVTCSKVKGTITFNPPLTNAGGASSETATVKATATKCSGGTPKPSKVISNSSITTTSNTCGGLATAAPPVLTETYSPGSISASTISGGSETLVQSPKIGFTINGESTAGSYPTTNTTSVSVTTSETTAAFGAACSSAGGLKKLTIKSGNVTGL